MDLVEKGSIINNRIHLDNQLKTEFTRHFANLRQNGDQDIPYLPFFHLASSGFWHHRIRDGKESEYMSLKESNSENKVLAIIEHAYVDSELFEYFKSYNARAALKAALADNFDDDLRNKLLDPGRGWSWLECEAIARDYLEMLEAELRGEHYNKSEHNKRLQAVLNRRSKGSIERKHQNISAILKEIGMPTIDGYKPLSNYQRKILPDVVGALVTSQKELFNLIEEVSRKSRAVPEMEDILSRVVLKPAAKTIHDKSETKPEPGSYRPRKLNYIERENQNRRLGLNGERFIINYEKARLMEYGKDTLADKIEHVSREDDSLGFDIHSYETNGKDRYIEVKTTNYARYTHFYVTPNELNASVRLDRQYHLYRVFNFITDPKFYMSRGDINENFNLDLALFMANVN